MKYGKGIFTGAVTAVLGAKSIALAQEDGDEIASAGNGGVATASGNGGAVSAGDINSGGNVGSAIAVGNSYGDDPDVYGGDILNQTGLAVEVDGGTAIADATGGNNNLAFVS